MEGSSSKHIPFGVFAAILGVPGLVLVFSDLSRSETIVIRILIASFYFLLAGGVVGFFNPAGWLLSGLISWGGVFMGGFITLVSLARYFGGHYNPDQPPYFSAGLMILFGPLSLALLGGFLGKLLRPRLSRAPAP